MPEMSKFKKYNLLHIGLIISFLTAMLFNPVAASAEDATPDAAEVAAVTSTVPVVISISPDSKHLTVAEDFWVTVAINQVSQLNFYEFDVTYDSSVIRIEGTEGGAEVIGGQITDSSVNPHTITNYPINWWYTDTNVEGRITISGNLDPWIGASGGGYLAGIHFKTVGTYGDESNIIPLKMTLKNRLNTNIYVNGTSMGTVNIPFPPITVSIDAPANLSPGEEFIARVNVSTVIDLQAFQFEITYNPNVIRIIGAEGGSEGVTSGKIGLIPLDPESWVFVPEESQGTVRVITKLSTISGVTGEGYLVDIHFRVVGVQGQSTALSFVTPFSFENILVDPWSEEIDNVTWVDAGCQVNSRCHITSMSPLPLAEIGLNYQTELLANGGVLPYNWSVTDGSLPDGLSLDPILGIISGTPALAADTSRATIQVIDNNGTVLAKSFLITVLPAAKITTTELPSGQTGLPYIHRLEAEGGLSPYQWNIASDSLPSGLQLYASTGTISGIIKIDATSKEITFMVTDVLGATAFKKLTVNIIREPVIVTSSPLPTGEVGISYYQKLEFFGGTPPATWSIVSGGLPGGLSLRASSGVISGTPSSSTKNPIYIEFKATDSAGKSASKTLSLTILAKPNITTSVLPIREVGAPYKVILKNTGGLSPFTWTINSGSLPDGLTLNSRTGEISGAANQTADAVDITFAVTDSLGGIDTRILNITIQGPPLITTTLLANGEIGNDYTGILTAKNGTAPYTWSIVMGDLPDGLELDPTTGEISGNADSAGTFQILFQVTDSVSGCSTRQLSITILSGPLINDLSLNDGEIGLSYYQTLTASGGTSPYKWSIVSGVLPAGLVFNANAGLISGKPTVVVNSLSITFKVTSKLGGSSTKTLQISTFTKPVITTSTLAGVETGLYYLQTLSAAEGKDPYTWSVQSGQLPEGFTLDPGTGNIAGTTSIAPTSRTITFKVTDKLGGTASKGLTIKVAAGPAITTAALPDGEVGIAFNNSLAAKGGVPPYTWSLISGILPPDLTLNKNTGMIKGTPSKSADPSQLTFQVADSLGGTGTKNFNFTVFSPPGISTTAMAQGEIKRKYSQRLDTSGGTSPFTWSVQSGKLPSGLSLNKKTGVVSGTPKTAGTTTLTFKVTDKNGGAGIKELTIKVSAAPTITTKSPLASGEIGIAFQQTLSAANGVEPYTWSMSSKALPQGLTLNPATGLISGTPTKSTNGTAIVFKVTDSLGGYATRSITIKIFAAPVITTAKLANGKTGTSYKQTLAKSGGTAPFTWSVIGDNLPTGLTLNPATGVISGKPSQKTGVISITIKLTDSLGVSVSKTFSFAIN
jgi:hypothetical protein